MPIQNKERSNVKIKKPPFKNEERPSQKPI